MERKLLVKVVLVSAASVVLTLLVVVGVAWAADIFTVDQNGAVYFRITDSGRVGINVDPTIPLHLRSSQPGSMIGWDGSFASGKFAELRAGTNGASIGFDETGHFYIGTISAHGQINLTNGLMKVENNGKVGIGTMSPATSAKLEVAGTDGAILIPRLTTAQRDALTAANGMIVYNTTTNAFNFCENGAWGIK